MITDELREWKGSINTRLQPETVLALRSELNCIADRIDERHERALRESYDSGYASADDWLAQNEDAMAEHGWVRLPVDRDGVPVRIGDVMAFPTSGEPFEVIGIGDGTLFYEDGERFANWLCARSARRHHAPTVEDVLREFADEVQRCCDTSDTIAEYAAKLRLAGEGE